MKYMVSQQKSARFKVRAIVVLLGWQHWNFNICHLSFLLLVVMERYTKEQRVIIVKNSLQNWILRFCWDTTYFKDLNTLDYQIKRQVSSHINRKTKRYLEFIYENLLHKTRNTSSKTDATSQWHTKMNLYAWLQFISMSTVTILPQDLQTAVRFESYMFKN